MEVGQVIVVTTTADSIESCSSPEIVVSPTAAWTQPVQDPIEISSPPRKVSKFDVGECGVPNPNAQINHGWMPPLFCACRVINF